MSLYAAHDAIETAPLPPAPPRQTAFAQTWRIALAHPGRFALCMGLWAIFYALPLAGGLIQREFFDTLSGRRPAGLNVWSLIGLWFAAQIAPLVAVYFAQWAYVSFTTLSRVMVRTNMLGWLMFAAGPRRPRSTAGEALSRFRDDVNETLSFMEGWSDTFGQALFTTGALIIMWRIDNLVTVAVIAPMLLVVAVTQRITAGIHKYSRVAREAEARVTSFVGEMFTAVQAVRVAGAEPRVLARLAALNDERRRKAVRYRIYVTLLDTFGVGTSSLALGLVLLLAASNMRDGRFTIGDFTLFAAYVGQATSAPRWLGRLLARKRTGDVALMRIGVLLDDAPDKAITAARPIRPRDLACEPLNLLEVKGLVCRYPGSGSGVEDIDFTLRRGQVTIVTGRVGSGKSTLLKAVLGLVRIEGGEILWNGQPVADPASFFTPPRCAYTAQSPRLFTETLRDNILMGLARSDADVDEAVHLAVLEEDLTQLSEGLQTRVGTRGVTLSGGQVQRSAAARMFVRTPELLVFDDASSALDVKTEHAFWDRLFASDRPHTCLAVSHRLEAYRRADEILLMDAGQIVARGDLRTLLRESPLFREVWRETMHAHAHPQADLTQEPDSAAAA